MRFLNQYFKCFISFLACFLMGAGAISAQDYTFSSIKGSSNAKLAESILSEAYQRIGLSFKVKWLPGQRALKVASEGGTDGELQRIYAIGERFPTLVRVSEPLFPLEGVVFTKYVDFPVIGKDSLKPYKIGILRGVRFTETLTDGMDVNPLDSGKQLINMLDRKRIDIFVISRFGGIKFVRESSVKGIRMLEPPVTSIQIYHYLHEKHRTFLPKIEKSLIEMREAGMTQKIIDAHIASL